MKKIILTSVFGVLFSMAALAQGSKPTSDANKMTKQAGYNNGVNLNSVNSDANHQKTMQKYENYEKNKKLPQIGPSNKPTMGTPKSGSNEPSKVISETL